MKPPEVDPGTHQFYEAQARRYPLIHARPIQQYSAEFERELMLRHVAPHALCLDVGCGEGRTARMLAGESGRTVVGVDFSVEMLRIATLSAGSTVVRYCAGDAMCLPFGHGIFDAVVAVTSLNNVPDLHRSLQEMGRVLKPDGVLIILVINRHEAAAVVRAIYYFPFYLYRWLRGGKPYRSLTFSARELSAALPHGLQVVEFQGMRMVPDFLPEWPFNFYPVFQPTLRRALRWLAPVDRWLCQHPWFGKLARFHFVVARKCANG